MPPPLCMGCQPWPLLIAAVMVLSIMPASANQAETETAPLEGSLLDVAFMPTSCLKNETCDAHRPVHLIEYFSADWCEPCVEVGEALNGMANNQTIVLQHHPSPQDSTFFSDSKQRNDDDVARALDEIRNTARADRNVMDSLVEASITGCTLGEMVSAMGDVYGRYTGGPEW